MPSDDAREQRGGVFRELFSSTMWFRRPRQFLPLHDLLRFFLLLFQFGLGLLQFLSLFCELMFKPQDRLV